MKHQARALRVLAFFVCAPVCAPNVHQGQIPGLFIMTIKPCKCFAGLTACNAPDLAGIVPVIQPRARRHVAASRFACFARYWRIEASRFGAKRGSRCCELSRNEGLRCCGACCYGLGRLNTVSAACPEALSGHGCSRRTGPGFSGHEPQLLSPCRAWLSRARAAVALAMPGLVFRGAGSNFSRRIGLGFPGMGRSCHSRPSPGGCWRMWRACAQEVCKPDNSRRAGHAKVANARRCRTNANSAAIILQV